MRRTSISGAEQTAAFGAEQKVVGRSHTSGLHLEQTDAGPVALPLICAHVDIGDAPRGASIVRQAGSTEGSYDPPAH